ncbi:hypothetical protein B1748_18835 [Paenibacillus sp. MY03]|nr:hypothetical protein B1748_18835 [Paenibacillus sp. MY03]
MGREQEEKNGREQEQKRKSTGRRKSKGKRKLEEKRKRTGIEREYGGRPSWRSRYACHNDFAKRGLCCCGRGMFVVALEFADRIAGCEREFGGAVSDFFGLQGERGSFSRSKSMRPT